VAVAAAGFRDGSKTRCRDPAARLQQYLADDWLVIAVPLFIIMAAAEIYAAIGQHFEVSAALVLTLNLIIALLLFETLLNFMRRRLVPADAQARRTRPQTVTTCTRMAAIIVVIIVLAHMGWERLRHSRCRGWLPLRHAIDMVGGALFVA
jgi:hypothetical protein